VYAERVFIDSLVGYVKNTIDFVGETLVGMIKFLELTNF
jgi:hypothetical protein